MSQKIDLANGALLAAKRALDSANYRVTRDTAARDRAYVAYSDYQKALDVSRTKLNQAEASYSDAVHQMRLALEESDEG